MPRNDGIDLNPIEVEILFVAGLRQAQTDNNKKIETKSGAALTEGLLKMLFK